MCNLGQLTTTDRVLLGQHVAVTAPTLQRSREYVTQVAQALRGAGHHVYHSIGKLALDNGGTLEALPPMGAFVRDPDHIVYLGAMNSDILLAAVAPTGGTISRR